MLLMLKVAIFNKSLSAAAALEGLEMPVQTNHSIDSFGFRHHKAFPRTERQLQHPRLPGDAVLRAYRRVHDHLKIVSSVSQGADLIASNA